MDDDAERCYLQFLCEPTKVSKGGEIVLPEAQIDLESMISDGDEECSSEHTRNQDRSARTRRNDVVNEPVPRPLRVLTTAVTVPVS